MGSGSAIFYIIKASPCLLLSCIYYCLKFRVPAAGSSGTVVRSCDVRPVGRRFELTSLPNSFSKFFFFSYIFQSFTLRYTVCGIRPVPNATLSELSGNKPTIMQKLN